MSDNNMLEKIYEKVEKLSDDMSEIKVTSATQTEQLKQHMRRSDLLEEQTELLRESIVPVQKHVDMVTGVLKFFGLLGVLATIIRAIAGIL